MKERAYVEQVDLHIQPFANMTWLENYLQQCPLNIVQDDTRLRIGDKYIDWTGDFPAELNTLFRIGVRGHVIIVFNSGWHTKFKISDKGVDSCHCELVENKQKEKE